MREAFGSLECNLGEKISLIIPHLTHEEADICLKRCLRSFKDQYDELILVINDGIGYGEAVNRGLEYSSGDFLIVSNNDIELLRGTLRDLPCQKYITVPDITPPPRDFMPRSIFCMPRWAYMQISSCGYFYDPIFSEGGGGYFEDDDLINRLGGIEVTKKESVLVSHLNGGGLTMKMIGEQKYFDINKKKYEKKWSK